METQYFYFGSTLLFTADIHGYKLTENVIDPYGNTLLSKRYIAGAGNELGYYAMNTDVRGSTTNVIRADGTSVTGFVYDEFGKQIKTGERDFIVDATYTGSIYDEETGLQYMNARYYDPGVGRFISRDSYLGSSHEPWTQHLYGYTGGNPVNFVDPTGHIWETFLDIGSAFVSLWDLITEPSWENAGYLLWDVGSALIPFVPGSYTTKATKYVSKAVNWISDSKIVKAVGKYTDEAISWLKRL